jgi:hypothetical protein
MKDESELLNTSRLLFEFSDKMEDGLTIIGTAGLNIYQTNS